MPSLRDGYSLDNKRRHGSMSRYPFLLSVFPKIYYGTNGKITSPPFQFTLAAGEVKRVPFRLPKDSLFQQLYFRYDVTDGNYSCMLSDIAIDLYLQSGGDRTQIPQEQLGCFNGINSGFAQIRMPYIHPKEGSVVFSFKNKYPGTRAISGWFYGSKVQS